MFRVGQKVVCVNARKAYGSLHPCPLKKGAIYTVSEVVDYSADPLCHPRHRFGLFLCEIARGPHEDGFYDAFHVRRFRPAVERKTDISIFKKLLAPKRQRELTE
jgi:hypothetical protein